MLLSLAMVMLLAPAASPAPAEGAAKSAELVRRYRAAASPDEKASLAQELYSLGHKSDEAKKALLADVKTEHQALRLQVQWALGRVSGDPDVVEVLLDNMQHDGNLLFRDKAACALAYDQIHLNAAQKVRLFEGLVGALDDPKLDVRSIALQALRIHTGQDRGFVPQAPPEQRARARQEWQRWLDEYRAQY